MIYSSKKSLAVSALGFLFGAFCFILVIPFGLIFGLLFQLFGSSHQPQKKAY